MLCAIKRNVLAKLVNQYSKARKTVMHWPWSANECVTGLSHSAKAASQFGHPGITIQMVKPETVLRWHRAASGRFRGFVVALHFQNAS
jgi:hypothetical protein